MIFERFSIGTKNEKLKSSFMRRKYGRNVSGQIDNLDLFSFYYLFSIILNGLGKVRVGDEIGVRKGSF